MKNNLRRDFSTEVPGAASNAGRKRVMCPITRDKKTYWMKVGVAFQNKDGSWNLYVDAWPVNGKLQLREWDEPSWESRNGRGGGGGPGMSSLSFPTMDAPDNENQPGNDLPF